VETPLRIANRDARRLWLDAQALWGPPTGPLDVPGTVRKLGFVQLDTIRYVARAHHHILWSRNRRYREPMLDRLRRKRLVFEHFTHDASVLPIETYPFWRRRFRQMEEKVRGWEWHRGMHDEAGRAAILERIRAEGPLSTRDFDAEASRPREMWRRPPHKLTLDYLWYAGVLATSHRVNFTKFYDLAERVIPECVSLEERSEAEQVEWLCRAAIVRLVFASEGEIQRFWAAASAAEVRQWAAGAGLMPVEVEGADGRWTPALATPDIETRLAEVKVGHSGMRLLNPFDPVVRDRGRLARLFGFDYRIEIFVPAAKRRWGYYVFPLLERDRFVGRIDVKAERAAGRLIVAKLWPEPGVRWTSTRQTKLEAELQRLARFVGVADVVWS
jgi:uncharacterized protein